MATASRQLAENNQRGNGIGGRHETMARNNGIKRSVMAAASVMAAHENVAVSA
jgi:hypothetical protein